MLGHLAVSDLPTLYQCFTPPPEQPVAPGQSGDYVGVYAVVSHVTIVTKERLGSSGPKIELWRPVFDCDMPPEMVSAGSGRLFALWFSGIPSERGHFGSCVREIRITRIAKTKEGRDLRPGESIIEITEADRERWRKNDAIFARLLAGCSEAEFASLQCPVCSGGLFLAVHPKLHTFFVGCSASAVHLGRHGEIEQAPVWWHSRVTRGWYDDSVSHPVA